MTNNNENKQYTLKGLRKSNRRKVRDIINYLGISERYYYYMENKNAVINVNTKAKIAEFYNVHVSEIKF